jgi:hypothetical protein
MKDETALAVRLANMRPQLNEREWRRFLGCEAQALGRGGARVVARLSGSSRTTVRKGMQEILAGEPADGRIRRRGAGRPLIERAQPEIETALEALVSPYTRGDPMLPLRWTTKSLAHLTRALQDQGFQASTTTVKRLLRKRGYRLQSTFKNKEEKSQHPDRDNQFRYINDTVADYLSTADPAISIDCKKKELVGEYANKKLRTASCTASPGRHRRGPKR